MIDAVPGDWIGFVAGSPIAQSLSPAIHEAAFRAAGRQGSFGAVECAPSETDALVGLCRTRGLVGASVTMPLKEALAGRCDDLSPDAAILGAVNCLRLAGGRIEGHNTDGAGCVAALERHGATVSGATAVVLGAGGTARSVALALARHGARVVLVNRTASRAVEAVASVSRATGLSGEMVVGDLAAVGRAGILVNATSVGMGSDAVPVPVDVLHEDLVVLDAVYHPLETGLLRAARAAGARGVDGVWMLVEQARLQQHLWFGDLPDAGVMRKAAEAGLAARQ